MRWLNHSCVKHENSTFSNLIMISWWLNYGCLHNIQEVINGIAAQCQRFFEKSSTEKKACSALFIVIHSTLLSCENFLAHFFFSSTCSMCLWESKIFDCTKVEVCTTTFCLWAARTNDVEFPFSSPDRKCSTLPCRDKKKTRFGCSNTLHNCSRAERTSKPRKVLQTAIASACPGELDNIKRNRVNKKLESGEGDSTEIRRGWNEVHCSTSRAHSTRRLGFFFIFCDSVTFTFESSSSSSWLVPT